MPKSNKTPIHRKKTPESEQPKQPRIRYIEAIGRRKTAVARARVTGGHGSVGINGKEAARYFTSKNLLETALAPFSALKIADKFDLSVKVAGGGVNAQAEATRLGISRALAEKNPDFGKRLHKLGFLTRDPRMVERKKYGLKKARRAPQWAKR